MTATQLSTENEIIPLKMYDQASTVQSASPNKNRAGLSDKVKRGFFAATATTLLFSPVLDITDHTISFSTTNIEHKTKQFDVPFSIREPFTFKNRAEVLKYIHERPDMLNLYKSLHVMIERIFGDARIKLSIFKDLEEDWSNLFVEIDSDSEIDELLVLEDKLFALIEEDDSFFAALEHVTISCG